MIAIEWLVIHQISKARRSFNLLQMPHSSLMLEVMIWKQHELVKCKDKDNTYLNIGISCHNKIKSTI